MANTVRNLLGLSNSSDYVRIELEKTNRGILYYEAIFIAILAFIAFLSSFFPIVPWDGKPAETLMMYRVGLLFASASSIVCQFICKRLAEATVDTSGKTRVLLIAYTTAILVIAIVLTAGDYANSHSFFVYIVALVLIFGLLYIQPLVTIAMNILYASILAGAIVAMGNGSVLMGAALSAYAFIVTVVSVSNYHSRLRAIVASDMVRRVSRHDALTGTKNRRAIEEDAASALGRQIYLLLGDIDDFKFYNDSFGHATGDKLLCAFADSMSEAFGHPNVYRYGGDEFVAIAFDVDEDEFQRMVASWRRSFAGVEVNGERYVPTTSGGFVCGRPDDVEELQDMLRMADIKLYDAKQAGRNMVLGITYEGRKAAAGVLDAERLRERRSGTLDPLTELPSMTYFTIHAHSLLESPALADATFYLVYFDIQDMTGYNERFGVAAGDELIAATARAIEAAFEHELVARMGDDRFVLLAYNTDPIEGIERVYKAVRAHNSASSTTIRAGVYEYKRGTGISAACDLAKLACNHVKDLRDAYYYVYDESLQPQDTTRRIA